MRTLRFLLVAVSFAVLCRTQTLAETYDPTPLSAGEIVAKAHLAEGTLTPGKYVEVRTQHGSDWDRTVTTQRDGNDWRTTVESGGITTATGSYQKRLWESDANGIVTLRTNFRGTSDPNALALRRLTDPEYHVTVLGLTRTQPQDYVIDVNPPNGVDEHLYYNAQTFLLDKRVSYERDRLVHTAEYTDYRTFFGKSMAGRIHFSDGRPEHDSVEKLVSFEPSTAVFDLRVPDTKPLFALDGAAPVVLPARFTSDGIIIQVKIGERGYDFFLDSGASGLFIDPNYARQLGDVSGDRARIPKMSIGPLQMHDVVFDTTEFVEQGQGERVIGLIGFDFIASAITELDFKAKTLTLYPRSGFLANGPGMRALPIQLDDGVPRTKASIEDVPGNFLVDTGAFMTLTYSDYVNKLPSTPRDPYKSQIGTVYGPQDVVVLHLSDFLFGGILIRSVDVVEPTHSTYDIMDYDGIIGRDALKVYKVTFDYADGILFLRDNI
jgi:hypothetical protein